MVPLQLDSLRQENAQLRKQLDEERRRPSRGATSRAASPRLSHTASGKSSLAPPVTVRALDFPVSIFIAMGEPFLASSRSKVKPYLCQHDRCQMRQEGYFVEAVYGL